MVVALNTEDKKFFWSQGYFIVRNIISTEEAKITEEHIKGMKWYKQNKIRLAQIKANGDYAGGFKSLNVTNQCTCNHGISKIGRHEKILDTSTYFYDSDVYCYHNKISAKPPGFSGFQPHQDFGGYWSKMGISIPDPHACFIAITKCDSTNGGLMLIPKSHLLGELCHTEKSAESGITESEKKMLDKNKLEAININLNPGDGVLFHGNTIHLSMPNKSKLTRIGLVVTLNTERAHINGDHNTSNHPEYTKTSRFRGKLTTNDMKFPSPFKTELKP